NVICTTAKRLKFMCDRRSLSSSRNLWVPAWVFGLILIAGSGCATTPYQFGRFHPGQPDGVDLQPIVIEHGEPNKALDRAGWVVGLPARILTLNKKVNNHDISSETLAT